jgi:ankyrin repeat protein
VGSIPTLKILLEEGKSPVNATDNDGLTALHHAISEGHGDAAILLLKAGADPEKKDGDGRFAIELVPDSKVGASPSNNEKSSLENSVFPIEGLLLLTTYSS